jgi:peptide/nickel transport system substrate-binding protein
MNVYDPYVRYAAMNISKGHMDNLTLRKAVFFAINTQALIDLSGGLSIMASQEITQLSQFWVLTMQRPPETSTIQTGRSPVIPITQSHLLNRSNPSDPAAYKKATVDGIVSDIRTPTKNQKASVLLSDALEGCGNRCKVQLHSIRSVLLNSHEHRKAE